jgi:TolB protein
MQGTASLIFAAGMTLLACKSDDDASPGDASSESDAAGAADGGGGNDDATGGGLAATCSARIAFGSLFVVNSDGTGMRTLSLVEGGVAPSWSPDGAKLAFIRDFDLWTINDDGTNEQDFDVPTFNPGDFTAPRWAPAGTQIALAWDPYKGFGQMFVVDDDDVAGEPIPLAFGGTASRFSWSPDGSRLAFICFPDDNWEVCAVGSDGSDEINLTQDPGEDDAGTPFWSSDGSQIFFLSSRSGNVDLWVMEADGSNPRNMTDSPEDEADATIFPDDSRVLFVRPAGTGSDLYSMNVDGTDLRNLTNDPERDEAPAISPDGTRIAWSTYRENDSGVGSDLHLHTANADGTERLAITSEPTGLVEGPAVWEPCD